MITNRISQLFAVVVNRWKRACCLFFLCVTTAIASPAQTFTTLHIFDFSDGSLPYAGLIQATDGNLYGTTFQGGTNGGGTAFKITPSGTLKTLYNFCSVSGCADGNALSGGLVQVGSGSLYGMTQQGGPNNGSGTVFKITLSGALTTLHNFDTTDGRYPYAGLVQAGQGNFFGTTYFGGANSEGTVFKITPTGTLTTLHSFANTDGIQPQAGLVQASDGNLYGTTQGGGTSNEGTVFKITPGGTLTTLHSFCSQTGCPDGSSLYAGLVQATDGNLYGTTVLGGTGGEGTIFKITPGGTLTTLHSFDSTDGAQPYAGLIQATDGILYGTTKFGGANNDGTIFKITLSGTLTTLHSFDATDGSYPYAALVQDTNGSFYGTTLTNGSNTSGTVFRLSVGLHPFVETQTSSGKVGATVKILGTKLTGATSVMFNGTAAVFKVKSGSLITTTVPQGATTGFVSVTTPKGTLKSNRKFLVTR